MSAIPLHIWWGLLAGGCCGKNNYGQPDDPWLNGCVAWAVDKTVVYNIQHNIVDPRGADKIIPQTLSRK